MNCVGMTRVQNEERWIERCIRSMLLVCDHVYLMDDRSTDRTGEIASAIKGVTVWPTPYETLQETRDKNWLYGRILKESSPDWIFQIDGDEELCAEDAGIVLSALVNRQLTSYSLPILYLWDRADQIRVDGVYGRFRRPSLFRVIPGAEFSSKNPSHGLHCGNVPFVTTFRQAFLPARLLHYGYMDRQDRIRKWRYYNDVDPNNEIEDRYRHIVLGDLPEFSAELRTRYSGPLELRSI